MPDLLAHAFVAYTICTLLGWRYEWIAPEYVTVGMAGAFIPDLTKVRLLLPSEVVESILDVPFSWTALHTTGGAAISLLIGVVVVASEERRRVGALLAVGAASHLLADALLDTSTGYAYPILWPLTRYRPPTPGLYLSTQPWPTIVAGVVAGVVWAISSGRAQAALEAIDPR